MKDDRRNPDGYGVPSEKYTDIDDPTQSFTKTAATKPDSPLIADQKISDGNYLHMEL